MICPNKTLSLQQLEKMVYSDQYKVFYEPFDEPENYDWKKHGIWRSPDIVEINDEEGLIEAIRLEFEDVGRIVYDFTEKFYKQHPYEGEEVKHIEETFNWEYASNFGNKYCYKICPCSYLGEKPKYVPLEIVCFPNGFNDSCFQIGSWERDDEGYEFKSCGSRLFEYVEPEDIEIIWNIIKEADKFLENRFKNEASIGD